VPLLFRIVATTVFLKILTVFEVHQYAKNHGCSLPQVLTYVMVHQDASLSGGTAATVAYKLGKNRQDGNHKPKFDPLLKTPSGTKSEHSTKNVSHKSKATEPELNHTREILRHGSFDLHLTDSTPLLSAFLYRP
jgi:hypothetical protein